MHRALVALAPFLLASAAFAQTTLVTMRGARATRAGDVDADGTSDFATGTDLYVGHVFSGATGFEIYFKSLVLPLVSPSVYPAIPGDLDGDGFADFMFGLPSGCDLVPDSGHAYVFSGSTGLPIVEIPGLLLCSNFGQAMAGIGDVTGDGRPDFLIGAPGWKPFYAGSAHLYSGATQSLLGTLAPAPMGSTFGSAVAGIGDANGDGIPDFAVASVNEDDPVPEAGCVRVFASPGTFLYKVRGAEVAERFGTDVAGVGDLDGDGKGDFLVGAPHSNVNGAKSGRAVLFSGATGVVLREFKGLATSDELGNSVASVGDADGDGVPDFAIGAPQGYPSGRGYVLLFSGKSGLPLLKAIGPFVNGGFGTSIATAGDVDHDGFADLQVASPFEPPGIIRVLSMIPGLSEFGAGTPGCSGPEKMGASAPPKINQPAFKIRCSAAPPNSVGLGLVASAGTLSGVDPFGIGVLLNLDLLASTEILVFDFVVDATGQAVAIAPIPDQPALVGKVYKAQGVFDWSAGPCMPSAYGLSSSNGLSIEILAP